VKIRSRLSLLAASAFITAGMFGSAPATAGNGIQFDAFDASGSVYIDCLDEFIDYEEHIDIAFHEFMTPSGNYHVIDNWTFSLTATGASTGRTWVGVLQSPGQINDGPADVMQWSIQGVIRSLTKGAPNFFWGFNFRSVVNANGDLQVLQDSGGTYARCLGNK